MKQKRPAEVWSVAQMINIFKKGDSPISSASLYSTLRKIRKESKRMCGKCKYPDLNTIRHVPGEVHYRTKTFHSRGQNKAYVYWYE